MICRSCETVAHCLRCGCIPVRQEEELTAREVCTSEWAQEIACAFIDKAKKSLPYIATFAVCLMAGWAAWVVS